MRSRVLSPDDVVVLPDLKPSIRAAIEVYDRTLANGSNPTTVENMPKGVAIDGWSYCVTGSSEALGYTLARSPVCFDVVESQEDLDRWKERLNGYANKSQNPAERILSSVRSMDELIRRCKGRFSNWGKVVTLSAFRDALLEDSYSGNEERFENEGRIPGFILAHWGYDVPASERGRKRKSRQRLRNDGISWDEWDAMVKKNARTFQQMRRQAFWR